MKVPYGTAAPAAKMNRKPRYSAGNKPVKTSFEPMIVPPEKRGSARVSALQRGMITGTEFAGGSLNLGLLGGRGPVR